VADPRSDRLSAALEGRYAVEREIGQGGMVLVEDFAEELRRRGRD